MDDVPRSVAGFLRRLRASRFELVHEETGGHMGSGLMVFRRQALEIRVINDRGQWTADLVADDWLDSERLAFPIFVDGSALPL
jgi:hypothetical protein